MPYIRRYLAYTFNISLKTHIEIYKINKNKNELEWIYLTEIK